MEFTEFMRQLNRMCQSHPVCNYCEFKGFCYDDSIVTISKSENAENLQKMEQIVEQWVNAHPVKTRKSEFLKMFPNADLDSILPCDLDKTLLRPHCNDDDGCVICMREYWDKEVTE